MARLHLADGVPLLRPEEQVFSAMLDGWRNQQLARNLAFSTVEGRERVVRAFAVHADAFPWQWTPLLVDEWCTDLRAVRGLRRSTLRQYQESVRMLCDYLTDPEYGWAEQCIARFGTHPVQVCHEWNTAVHAQQAEGDPVKRAFTQDELQAFFDYADEQVARDPRGGAQGLAGRVPGRDAVQGRLRATACAAARSGCWTSPTSAATRRRPSSATTASATSGYGKADKGSPPKRRSVLTVWAWAPEILGQWVSEVRPLMRRRATRRCGRRSGRRGSGWQRSTPGSRPTGTRSAWMPGVDFHSLRRSYVTHLIEAGWDALFVQQQAGHEHASTTSIYTCVSVGLPHPHPAEGAGPDDRRGAAGPTGGRR